MQPRCIPFCCFYLIKHLPGRNLEICPERLASSGSLRSHVVQDQRSSLLLGTVKHCQTAWNAHGHFSAFCTVCERFASFWGASLRVICPVGRRHIDYCAFPKRERNSQRFAATARKPAARIQAMGVEKEETEQGRSPGEPGGVKGKKRRAEQASISISPSRVRQPQYWRTHDAIFLSTPKS